MVGCGNIEERRESSFISQNVVGIRKLLVERKYLKVGQNRTKNTQMQFSHFEISEQNVKFVSGCV